MPRKPKLRHKIRGVRIGAADGDADREIVWRIAGKPDYERDATELLSFLLKLPDGTVRALVRQMATTLSTIAGELPAAMDKIPRNGQRLARAVVEDPRERRDLIEQALGQFDLFNDDE